MKLIPVVTEKSTKETANGKYTFYVDMGMDKFKIRKAVEETFGVTVKKVWVINSKPEKKWDAKRRPKKTTIKRKTIVELADKKQKIDLFEEKK